MNKMATRAKNKTLRITSDPLIQIQTIYTHRGYNMSAHVLFNLLNKVRKRDKMQGLSSILSLFHSKFNKFNNTRAQMLDSFYYDIKVTLKSHFCRKKVKI